MRINRYLSQSGVCSRRKADDLIKQGRVLISGRKAVAGSQVSNGEGVTVDGERVRPAQKRFYYMYHKPEGVICSADPRAFNNIIDAVKLPVRVFPVGRIDVDSSGLIFLTNDGEFANRILHPRFHHEKEYEVEVEEALSKEFLSEMREGIVISGEKTLPARVTKISQRVFRIVLKQGMNRQIRRMCKAGGCRVKRLMRIRIINISIGNLASGMVREIRGGVLQELLQNSGLSDINR